MEDFFSEDSVQKIKLFKWDKEEEYEGEYTFTVCVGVVDNAFEIKETITTCKLTQVEKECYVYANSYKPESWICLLTLIQKRRENIVKHIKN